VRAGVGRPDATDPEVVSAYVLSAFREPRGQVEGLVAAAADEAERLVGEIFDGEREQGEKADG
jgi:peptidyl-tRNA hydrolase, PTH1 family